MRIPPQARDYVTWGSILSCHDFELIFRRETGINFLFANESKLFVAIVVPPFSLAAIRYVQVYTGGLGAFFGMHIFWVMPHSKLDSLESTIRVNEIPAKSK